MIPVEYGRLAGWILVAVSGLAGALTARSWLGGLAGLLAFGYAELALLTGFWAKPVRWRR